MIDVLQLIAKYQFKIFRMLDKAIIQLSNLTLYLLRLNFPLISLNHLCKSLHIYIYYYSIIISK